MIVCKFWRKYCEVAYADVLKIHYGLHFAFSSSFHDRILTLVYRKGWFQPLTDA